jgi:hypothetical protein
MEVGVSQTNELNCLLLLSAACGKPVEAPASSSKSFRSSRGLHAVAAHVKVRACWSHAPYVEMMLTCAIMLLCGAPGHPRVPVPAALRPCVREHLQGCVPAHLPLGRHHRRAGRGRWRQLHL